MYSNAYVKIQFVLTSELEVVSTLLSVEEALITGEYIEFWLTTLHVLSFHYLWQANVRLCG